MYIFSYTRLKKNYELVTAIIMCELDLVHEAIMLPIASYVPHVLASSLFSHCSMFNNLL